MASRNCATSNSGRAIDTPWPSDSQSLAASSVPLRHSGSTGSPFHGSMHSAMRSLPGSRPTSSRNLPDGAGAKYGSPTSGPWLASSSAALSRTLMLTQWPTLWPPQPSPTSGPLGLRARVGFRPNRPQAAAGMRIEPPPSVACAIGRMRAATQAAAPPDEPPELWPRFHGLWQAPHIAGSVDGARPISGEAVLPKVTRPAAW